MQGRSNDSKRCFSLLTLVRARSRQRTKPFTLLISCSHILVEADRAHPSPALGLLRSDPFKGDPALCETVKEGSKIAYFFAKQNRVSHAFLQSNGWFAHSFVFVLVLQVLHGQIGTGVCRGQ